MSMHVVAQLLLGVAARIAVIVAVEHGLLQIMYTDCDVNSVTDDVSGTDIIMIQIC